MPKVSVIIPVYNTEKYIEKSARSLFGQTLEDIEFIFINDCTPDKSIDVLLSVLEEYPNRKSQVKIINNEVNKGQGEGRRIGVQAATGDYIIHCDSDDWIEPEMYEKLYSKAVEGNHDITICRIDLIDEAGGIIHSNADNLTSTDDFLGALLSIDIHHYLANKLVRRSLYEGVHYPVYNVCEDLALIIQLATNCRSYAVVDEKLYHYLIHAASTSHQENSEKKIEMMKANVELAIDSLREKNLYDKYIGGIRHLRRAVVKTYAQRLPRPYYKNLYREENFSYFFDKKLSFPEKMGHLTALLGIHGITKKFKTQ